MSVQAITWAFGAKPRNSTAKLVLLCLANYAGKDGQCWPGQQTIADDCNMSIRTVRNALSLLVEDGFIVRERRSRSDGTRTSDLCFLQLDNRQELPLDNRQNLHTLPAKSAGQYKPKGLSEPVREPKDTRASKSDLDLDFEEWRKQYPRRVSKPKELQAYLKARRMHSHAQIMAGTLAHVSAWATNQTETRFIPHPTTFLNQERFNVRPEPPRHPKPTDGNGAASLAQSLQDCGLFSGGEFRFDNANSPDEPHSGSVIEHDDSPQSHWTPEGV